MNRIVLVLCFCLCALFICKVNVRAVGMEFAETIADKAKPSVIPIMSQDGATIIGTGFLVNSKDNTMTFVITNAHVVAGYFGNKMSQNVDEPSYYLGKQVLGRMSTDNGWEIGHLVISYFDSKIDIAVCTILRRRSDEANWPYKNGIGDYSLFCSSNEINEGKPIVVIGYPLNLGAEYLNFPVITSGIVAQSGNTASDTFLIDATINPGNSGSPVFSTDQSKTGFVYVGTANAYKTNSIRSYDENGQLVAVFPYNSGLATVIRAQKIRDIIDSLSKKSQ